MTQDRTGKGLRDKVSTEIALSRQITESHNPSTFSHATGVHSSGQAHCISAGAFRIQRLLARLANDLAGKSARMSDAGTFKALLLRRRI
jgi:hypothetical protein